MKVASVLEATLVLEATFVLEAGAMHSTLHAREPAPAYPIGEDRGGEGDGQHPHERETDDPLHGQLLSDGSSAGAPASTAGL
jgi:hypothetical protein